MKHRSHAAFIVNGPERTSTEAAGRRHGAAAEWTLFALFAFFLCTQLVNEFNNPDGIGYYAHLRSAVLDRDIYHLDEFETLRMTPYFYSPSPTGLIQNQWPVGTSILWAPFYAAGRAGAAAARAAGAAGAAGADIPADGYGRLDSLSVNFASAFYGFLALWLCLKMLRRRGHSGRGALFAVTAVWVGTPMFFYQFYAATLAHSCSAFAAAGFVYVWERDRGERKAEGWALLGGLAAMTRTETAVLFALPLVDAAALCFAPQMVVWAALNGGPLDSYQGAVNLLPLNPHPLETIFSAWHGLFAWSPVALLAAAGWVLLARRDGGAGAGFWAVFVVLVYVNSSLIWWWEGGAFGARCFVGLLPFFALGLAEFAGRTPRAAVAALTAACLAWTFALLAQFLGGDIFLEKYYPFAALAEGAGRVVENPWRYLKLFLAPKSAGLPAGLVLAVVSAGLFAAVKRGAGRVGVRQAVAGLLVFSAVATGWAAHCASNSRERAAGRAAEVGRAGAYTLEELYEPFPIQYANYYIRSGRVEAGLRDMRKLEGLLPGNPAVYLARAGLLLSKGERDEACEAAARAAALPMRHPATRAVMERVAAGVGGVEKCGEKR